MVCTWALTHLPPKICSTIPSTAHAPQLHFRPIDHLVLLLLVPGANTLLGGPEDMGHGTHCPCQPATLSCLLVCKDSCDAELQTQLGSIISNLEVDPSPMVAVAIPQADQAQLTFFKKFRSETSWSEPLTPFLHSEHRETRTRSDPSLATSADEVGGPSPSWSIRAAQGDSLRPECLSRLQTPTL